MPLDLVNKKAPMYSPLNGNQNPLFWFGDLSPENAEAIAVTLRQLLAGKRHTVAVVNDGRLDRVHTDNELEYIRATSSGGLVISDSYGLWCIYAPAYISFRGEQVFISHKAGAGTELQWVFATQRGVLE